MILSSEVKYLSALALFKSLYEADKKNIYDVIEEFCIQLIITKKKTTFSSRDMKILLSNEFGFNIPEAVLRTVFKRAEYITLENRIYTVSYETLGVDITSFEKNLKVVESDNKKIVERLIFYCKKELGNDVDEEQITKNLYTFLVEGKEAGTKYSSLISKYIVSKENDEDFIEKLDRVREGVIIQAGLSYNSDINHFGSLKKSMNLYLTTELLFSLAGYNGELFKSLVTELYDLIVEINVKSTSKRKKISLWYFSETEKEIDSFFSKACDIVDGKYILDPSNLAMASIVKGCSLSSEVIEKKVRFKKLLSDKNIYLHEKTDFYSPDNHKYNLESPELLNKLQRDCSRNGDLKSCETGLKFVNYINILNKGKGSRDFESVMNILITMNSNYLRVGFSKHLKKNGCFPNVTDLGFVTNRLWFKLNKGFGKMNKFKSFSVVASAQVLVANMLNASVSNTFEDLTDKLVNDEITEESAQQIMIELKNVSVLPESIDASTIESVYEFINENSLDKMIIQIENKKIELENIRCANEELTKIAKHESMEREKIEKKLENVKDSFEKSEKDKNVLQNELNETKLRVNQLEDYFNNEEERRKNKRNKKIKIRKVIFNILFVTFLIGMFMLCVWSYESENFYLIALFVVLSFFPTINVKKIKNKMIEYNLD
ncbi:hypothetical protein EZV73_15185 [Acidaminobacter sp. JC074]|uniref:hypothetical protein n=1 Tax=Acidaminobacter sp. JC074 TaxID=2530199 RepID=UPI001F0ECA67|nr:hypothetical protein [Acidaminobacter sp. JC074]MCH4888937.1 hypothetical protein [Acidaminobacter sp. JC074]